MSMTVDDSSANKAQRAIATWRVLKRSIPRILLFDTVKLIDARRISAAFSDISRKSSLTLKIHPSRSNVRRRDKERGQREREGMGRRTKKCPSQISVDLDLDLDSPSVKLTLRDTEGARCGCTLIRRSCAERQSSRSRPEISRLSITRPCGDIDHGVVAGSCVDLPFHR